MFGRWLSEGMILEDCSLDGMPYIFHSQAVSKCSCYFLNWVPPRNGDPAKSVCKPSHAKSHEETETDEEG